MAFFAFDFGDDFLGGAFLVTLAAAGAGTAFGTGFCGTLAGSARLRGTAGTVAPVTPFPFFFPPACVVWAGASAAAAFAPRPRFGGGGGGGGGGASGFRNFKISVRERSFPSNRSMNTSSAIFGYSGNCGVM